MNANGGMSMSNNFVVQIGSEPTDFKNPSGNGNIFEFLCDEAQLPNTQAASGELKGRYTGEGQVNYPHTRIYTEMQLGFQCDANMTPLKYLYDWYGDIFKENDESGVQYSSMEDSGESNKEAAIGMPPRVRNRTVTLNYPDDYCKTIYITKTELGPRFNFGERVSTTFVLERAWPYAIDAVPLQFGSAQITKVTAQFYYTKHYVISNDINRKFKIPFT